MLKYGGITSKIEKRRPGCGCDLPGLHEEAGGCDVGDENPQGLARAQKIKDDPDVASLNSQLTTARSSLTAASTKLQTDLASSGG